MKHEIEIAIGSMQDKMMGNVTYMSYCYSQLCVKAEPMCLLQVEVVENGIPKNIEDLVSVIIHDEEGDDDKFDLFPKGSPECLGAVSDGIFNSYPEFKQSVEKIEIDHETAKELQHEAQETMGIVTDDVDDIYYLRVVVPPVDDDRKEALTKAINTVHDAIKLKMDTVYTVSLADITARLIGSTAEEIDSTKKTLDEIKSKYEEMREQETQNKLKEVEEANKRYHTQHPDDDAQNIANDWQKMKM